MNGAPRRELPRVAPGEPAPRPLRRAERAFTDLLAVEELLRAERSWLFEGAIEGNPLAVWAAPEKSAKSWIMIDACVAAITGGRWLGEFPCKRPGAAVYCDAEYGDAEFVRRLSRVCRAHGTTLADVAPKLSHYYSRDLRLQEGNEAGVWLAEALDSVSPTLIVLDPWRNHLVGDENSAADTMAACAIAAGLKERSGAAVLIPHHLNKAGVQSGSRALLGRADLIFEGTDAVTPMYSAKGRTIRRVDPISGRRFSVDVSHEHDADDTRAVTRVGLRWEGEKVTKAALSQPALRLLDAMQGATAPLSGAALGRLANVTNGSVRADALGELADAGLAERTGDGWSMTKETDHDRG